MEVSELSTSQGRKGKEYGENGIVIIDVTNPSDVQILSTFTENLTGGVHNVFIDKDFVYALSNGQWYEVVDISDPKNPKGVSKFVLPNSNESIHDVWIEDVTSGNRDTDFLRDVV